jgi:hypothetical protein
MATKSTKGKTTAGVSVGKSESVKSGNTKSEKVVSRSSERTALNAQGERMRNDPTYALEVARRAGIVGRDGRLTAYYKKS